MIAARLHGPWDLRLEEVPIPEPGPYDVLCKVKRAGICGTDYAIYSGEFSFVKSGDVHFPLTQGHEWSGVVERVGALVKNFKAGDRVISDTNVSCGRCFACLNGDITECKDLRPLGTIHAWDGAFAEYILMPERHVFHLADQISFDDGAAVEPATIAFSAVRAAEVKPGETVIVHGCGSIGIIAAKLAKIAGASKVFITGRTPFKLECARKFNGADVYISTLEETVEEVLKKELPSGKADKIIETSGSLELLQQSFYQVRNGGIAASVAFYEKNLKELDIDRLIFGNITFKGVANNARTYEPVLNLIASGALRPAELITGRYPFKDILQGYSDMKEKNSTRIKWILDFD